MTKHFEARIDRFVSTANIACIVVCISSALGAPPSAWGADSPIDKPTAALPVPTVVKPVSTRLKALLKQTSPEILAVGAKRVADLQKQHRSLADLAKRSRQTAAAMAQPYVYSVNDQKFDSVWIVPGAPYVFKGNGFGTNSGTIKLVGNFPNKAPTFRVDLWQDNTIYAYLEDDITGAYDQENIQLVVNAANGPIVKPGVKFLAAREKRAIDLALNLTKQNEPLFAATRQVSQHDAFVRVEGSETRSVTSLSPTCAVDNPDFRDGGVDSFRLPALRSGWIAAGYEYYVGPTDTGQGDYQGGPGRRQTLGKYKVYWSPPEIQMFWATFNSLSDPPCPSADEVWSYTAYELRVFIEGPRGTQAS